MPKHRLQNPRTNSQRAIDSQRARDVVGIQLPRAVMDKLDDIRARDGDDSRVAALTRLIVSSSRRG